ncbi:hypothetical protein EDD86DRAFT_248362 [Gorgonomyces haynaldii]|nr:hypothetical protein EDD86DRAFT_248362 [Gorgonomyces haynaldii]
MLLQEDPPIFLPLIDMTSKSLLLNGQDCAKKPNQNLRIREEMERFGMNIDQKYRHKYQTILPQTPVHLEHKFWCNHNSSGCNCQLLNTSAPEQTLVRVEGTEVIMRQQLGFAQTVDAFGEHQLLSQLKQSYVSQAARFESEKEMRYTLTFPILDTVWNNEKGQNACIPLLSQDEIKTLQALSEKKEKKKPKKKEPEPVEKRQLPIFLGMDKLNEKPTPKDLVPSFQVKKKPPKQHKRIKHISERARAVERQMNEIIKVGKMNDPIFKKPKSGFSESVLEMYFPSRAITTESYTSNPYANPDYIEDTELLQYQDAALTFSKLDLGPPPLPSEPDNAIERDIEPAGFTTIDELIREDMRATPI